MTRRPLFRFTRVVLSAGLVVAASSSPLGCSGSEASDLFASRGSDASTSQPPSSDGGTGGGTDDAGDVSPSDDGGAEPQSDGGIVADAGEELSTSSTPGKVPCGNDATCSIPQEICCYSSGKPKGCKASKTSDNCDEPVACDEKADCTGGKICCLTRDSGGNLKKTTCESSCSSSETGSGPSSFQICQTDEECPSKRCRTYDCKTLFIFSLPRVKTCENPFPPSCSEVK